MQDLVKLDVQEEIVLLTLNRPEKLNAINYAMNDVLLALLDQIEPEPTQRAIVITGAGERAFSAGGDIHEFAGTIAQEPSKASRDFVQRGQRMTRRLENYPKPIIAAVNGIAYGGGCEITEAVHLAVASDRAVFAKPEIAIGIPPTFGGTQRLPRVAGRKRALEHLLTGEPFDAARAQEIGLVNKIVPHADLIPQAFALAKRITCHSGLVTTGILAAVTRGLNTSVDEGLKIEMDQFSRLAATADTREGLNAWIERRVPIYPGN